MDIYFEFGRNPTIVRIEGNNLQFADFNSNFQFIPLKRIKLSISGILKEYPDLNGLSEGEIKEKAILRLKNKLKDMNLTEKRDYIIHELKNCGYTPKMIKMEGFRPIKLK